MVGSVVEDTSMRRYTEGERRAMLAELGASGKSLREFCEARGLNQRTVQRWQRDAREQNKERRPTVERNAPRKGPGFLPVEVAREHSPLRPGEGPLRSLWEPGIKEGRTFPRLIIQGGTGWVFEWQGPV
ncbi:hypothetical protein, partial [Treponema sp. J25]|uniref:IS66 family insertion sequence element accessory protein TnpA n=1 Tax=Treponema sp. J25 TaxID=2094121 RepID=UPI0010EBCA56